MTNRLLGCAVAFLALASAPPQGPRHKYTDPDSPDVKAAARAALANAKILDIIGVARSIEGTLRDLGARVVGAEIQIPVSADVLFDFDSATLRPEAGATLAKVADVLKEYSKDPVRVEGHTDGKGTAQYNQTLSEKRAAAVKGWLVGNGIPAGRMTTKGWGATKPVAPNTNAVGQDDAEARRRNRRVEIIVSRT